jgi:hypothetical protein
MSEPKPKRKMVHEEIAESLEKSLKEVLQEYPELNGLIVTFNWNIGQNDFPPCIIVTKEQTERSTVSMMSQILKALDNLSSMFSKQLFSASSIISRADEILKKSNNKS